MHEVLKGREDGGGKEKVKWLMDEQRGTRARLISQSGWSGYDRLP